MILSFNSGLGDTIQAIPVVKELLKKNKKIKVVTKYPELWEGICETVQWRPGVPHDRRISYIPRKTCTDSTQLEDVRIAAQVDRKLSPRIDWKLRNPGLIRKIQEDAFLKNKKKICLFKMPYKAMEDTERFKDVTPRKEPFELIVKNFPDVYFLDIGTLNTTVTDLIDIACSVDIFLAQIGHFITFADAFDKPILLIFARTGLTSETPFIKQIQPFKFINKKSTLTCIDDEPDKNFIAKFKELLNEEG